MLTRRRALSRRAFAPTPARAAAATLAAALTLVLAPPLAAPGLAPSARADVLDASVKQMMRDLREAGDQTHGDGVKAAILSDGVEDVLAKSAHVQDEKDFVHLPHPRREWGTLIASLMFGGKGDIADMGDLVLPGLVKDAELLPVRVKPDDEEKGAERWREGTALDTAVADGLRYAADHGARVIVVTDAWMYSANKTYAAIAYAQSKDALVIASVGVGEAAFPNAFSGTPGVLGVGTVDADGDRYEKYTKASSAVTIAAYGDKMPGLGRDGTANWLFWGEGPALATAASAAIMVRAAYPKLTAAQVVQAIATSGRNPKGHYTTDLGFGYLNASGALSKAATLAKRPPLPEKAQDGLADGAHFVKEPPGRVRAVPLSLPWFGGFGALSGLGTLMVGAALLLVVRRRPVAAGEASQPPADEPAPPQSAAADEAVPPQPRAADEV